MQDRRLLIIELRGRLEHAPGRVLGFLEGFRPEEVASFLSEVDDRDVERVFQLMTADSKELAAEVLSHLDRRDVARVFRGLPDDQVADVLEDLATEDATWAVELLPDKRIDSVVNGMEEAESRELRGRLD